MKSWDECKESLCARKVTPDPLKAKSLRDVSAARQAFLDQTFSEENANFIFEGLYTCVTEVIHAQALERGWSIENHVCLGYFIKDIIADEKSFVRFDTIRQRRNGIVYYGRMLPPTVAKESIRMCNDLLRS